MIVSHDYARLYHRGLCAHAKAERAKRGRERGYALLALAVFLGALCVCGAQW